MRAQVHVRVSLIGCLAWGLIVAVMVWLLVDLEGCGEEALSCDEAVPFECAARYGSWAPYCHGGVCSQCDRDENCGSGYECADNVDGFGTCLPVAHE